MAASELDEARQRIVALEVEIERAKVRAELYDLRLRAATAEANSETLQRRVDELSAALGRRRAIADSGQRGLRRLASRRGNGASDGA